MKKRERSGKTQSGRAAGGRGVQRPVVVAQGDTALTALVRAIVVDDAVTAFRLLTASPALATARAEVGATRQAAKAYYFDEIEHYLCRRLCFALAAAGYRRGVARKLMAMGADVRARNRRGAEP